MELRQNSFSEENLQPKIWWSRLLKYVHSSFFTKFLTFQSTRCYVIDFLSNLLSFPQQNQFIQYIDIESLLPFLQNVKTLKVSQIATLTVDQLINILSHLPQLTTLYLPGYFLCHSVVLIQLIHYSKLTKLRITGELKLISCFELLSSAKKLQFFSCEHPQFIEEDSEIIDKAFYSKPIKIQGLSCYIQGINSPSTSLSLPYYENLQFINITLLDESCFELKHNQLKKIIITSQKNIKVFRINCPHLQEIQVLQDAYITQQNFFYLMNQKYIQQIIINVYGEINLNNSQSNESLECLKITNQKINAAILDENVLKASIIQQIAFYYPNIKTLVIKNINTKVIDKHMFSLLVNSKQLSKLVISCDNNFQETLYFAQEKPKDNFFLQDNEEINSMKQALLYENKIQYLTLENISITDQFSYALFIYQHNYSLRKIQFNNLKFITDTSIFLLLTSTEIKQTKIQQVGRKAFSCPISDACQSDATNSGPCNFLLNKSLQESEKSFVSSFSILFFDGIIEEQVMYQLEDLQIINCSQISRKICNALYLAGYCLMNVQLSIPLSEKFIKRIQKQRPGIQIEGLSLRLQN